MDNATQVMSTVHVGSVRLSNQAPIAIIGGVNVLEDLDVALQVAGRFRETTAAYGMGYIFKASFDKANRSSYESYRGPGLQEGLKMLAELKRRLGVPVLTDVHESHQCEPVADVADMLQIPAFLSRQTDLLAAAARTRRPVHIKKMQSMAPSDMRNVRDKFARLGGRELVLCERGTSFGYGRLIVDPLAFSELKLFDCPVTFDVSHALQLPGALGNATGGRGERAQALALASVSQGLAGLFVEAHPDPRKAMCDGPCAIPMSEINSVLRRVKVLDDLVKSAVFE
jgi:2-dehydro-3-deoxyphosphooctonate aldolase (KDO 8-P synthase)